MPKKCFEQKDYLTINYLKIYCGELNYYFSDKIQSLEIKLPVHNDTLYGIKGLYCEYSIYNKDEIDSFTIKTNKNWGKLIMKIKHYYSSNNEEKIILGDGDQYIIKDPEEIKIIFESDYQKNIIPFSVNIIDTYNTWNKIRLLIIIISTFVILVCLLVLYILWKKRRKKILIGQIHRNNLNHFYINNFNTINNYNISSGRIGLKNYLNHLKPIKFKEVEKDATNNKCPIDMENFELNSDIILTECLHLFHYECIKTYIEKNSNLKEFKCPLCNHILYSTKIKDENIIINGSQFQK